MKLISGGCCNLRVGNEEQLPTKEALGKGVLGPAKSEHHPSDF